MNRSSNPYESPRSQEPAIKRRRRSRWSGPLLSLASVSFMIAFVSSSVTVAPGREEIVYLFIAFWVGLGIVAAVGAFNLHRRG